MADKLQIAAFEGGEFKILSAGDGGRETVLALPLARFISKVVHVPASSLDDPAACAAPVLQAMSPYADEPLTVSCERIRESADGGADVLALALPEGAADDIGEALDAAKLGVTRVDAIPLGMMEALSSAILPPAGDASRRLVLFGEPDGTALFVFDGGAPVAVRALHPGCDLSREVLLSLLDAESFAGGRPLAEAVVCGEIANAAAIEAYAPVRRVPLADPAEALARRAADPQTLNALPASWREVLEESRFKSRLNLFLAVAGGIWAVLMLVMFGGPVVYGFMTDHRKALSREHSRAYLEVKETKEKVELVRKYSDHSRGALEILKAVSDRLPQGVELKDWNFSRTGGLRISGESADAPSIYTFKDRLVDTGAFEGGVTLSPVTSRAGRQSFTIDCKIDPVEEGGR